MTEQQWLQATDPRPMLDFLKGKASDRKLWLFADACCCRFGQLLRDERMWEVVEAAERFRETRLRAGESAICSATSVEMVARIVQRVSHALGKAAFTDAGFEHDAYLGASFVRDSEAEAQAGFLRCIFGPLPFRPMRVDPAWLTWRDGLLVSMARRMYDSRDFADMPVLADALEEAGCTNPDVLWSCHKSGNHVRGCWVADLLLVKERSHDER